MANFELSDSVGNGGANRSADIVALRQRLIALGFTWVAADGGIDADLRQVINLVQSMKAGRNTLRGDGRVDVPGLTHDWLRAQNAPSWQVMPQGTATDGFFNFERADTGDTHDFGAGWMAETIIGAGLRYRDTYLTNHPGAALLTTNDVSLPRGGDTPDHAGHETGLACDLRLPRTDGQTGGVTHSSATYDADAMRAMMVALRIQPRVTRILFNDPDLIRDGLCVRAAGHDDHAHVEIAPLLPVIDYDDPIPDLLEDALLHFHGVLVDPATYPLTEAGFQSYLTDTGVRNFSAREMLTPHHPNVASGLGYNLFLPPHAWWRHGAVLALLSDEIRDLVGEPVNMRNWWRPRPYNAHPTVAGAEDSDHINASCVDLDFRSADSRRTSERRLREIYEDELQLQLSLGLGNKTIHVGLLSPGRHRDWFYSDYVK